MSRSHEIMTDMEHYKAIIFDGAWNRYEFRGRHGPVIGITGVGGGWHKEVRDYMITNNIGGVLSYFGLLTKGIDAYLPQLHQEINKYPNALVLGFSAGGIIALRYAQTYGWDRFQKIFIVATPFEGIPKRLGALGKTLKELSSESPFLKEILNIKPPKDKVLSFLSHGDRYIRNTHKLRENLNWPCAILGGSSHGSLQSSWKGIALFLDAELGITSV